MHAQSVLISLGYPKNQVKIYLAALKMGEFTLTDLAVQVAMPRSTVSELIKELHTKGLINYYIKKQRKIYSAENPNKLLTLLKEQEATLLSTLPSLQALGKNNREHNTQIKFFSGLEEVKNIFEDIIQTGHHIVALVSLEEIFGVFGHHFVDNFLERREQRFLQLKIMTQKTQTALDLKTRSQKLLQIKFIPENISLKQVSNFIYGNRCAFLSLSQKLPAGIIIEDANIADMQKMYFDSLWLYSKET